jgi:CheY-like chemotaxis protein
VSVPIRCLLVDDSDEFLRSAARLLESSGYEVLGDAIASGSAVAFVPKSRLTSAVIAALL